MNWSWLPPLRDRWVVISVGATACIAVGSIVLGFVWLPHEQPGVRFRGVWDAICSAAGLIRAVPAGQPVVQASYPVTQVEVIPGMLRDASAESIGRGATLALRCTMCHGARGMSQANAPNLAGQYPGAIYKELADFKSGARGSAIMLPLVADLSDRDMRDLAAYYAYLPRVNDERVFDEGAPRIVADGAPMRNIAPCGACHGELGNKIGAPWLEGQPAPYLHAQLDAFAKGTRRNDIDQQMRNVARGMTPAEITAASHYYAGSP
ncbi:MAG: c-type cytochrome [Acetobacteraceae bacterium]